MPPPNNRIANNSNKSRAKRDQNHATQTAKAMTLSNRRKTKSVTESYRNNEQQRTERPSRSVHAL